jgi:hypothetical protein
VSHSFVGWFPPTVLALHLGRHRPVVVRAVACLWAHLLLDTYADGIAWLWPATERKIGLFRKPGGIRDHGWETPAPLATELGRAELALWAAAALGAARSARWR